MQLYLQSSLQPLARPLSPTIAPFVCSNEFNALSDDSLKDDDNAAWILALDRPWRRLWLERVRWIRWVDRLAENDRDRGDGTRFAQFRDSWRRLRDENTIAPNDCWASLLRSQQRRWLAGNHRDDRRLACWDDYLDAIATYHRHDLTLTHLDDITQMFARLAGNFFQAFPFLEAHHADAARQFGILDQFYNNLRDLREDAEEGVSYFPEAVLDEFGVGRSQLLDGTAIGTPAHRRLMEFWLDDYLPQLVRNARSFLDADDLHPSWQILRYWSLHRYSRIEQVFYECNFDDRRFPERYWNAVRRDLANWRWFPRDVGALEQRRA